MSLAAKHLPRYNYEDYKRWEGNWELIDGVPFAMSPSPIRKHQRICFRLARAFEDALEQCESCEVLGELDWIIDEHTTVKPDLFIDCEKSDEDYLKHPPKLIVEVLSASTAHKDRNLKYELYESQGVSYYLLVNPINEMIEIYQLKNKAYQKQIQSENDLHIFDLEKCEINVSFEDVWK